ncbi:MAG: phosphoglycerate mutase (2,3-diphosphoglycerate-independent) [Candidatus Magasanikbacteria bacterium RIFOXYD2_FULL_39_9]|uniref:2,3-bisphosphoglycerate-independent phosphoglycerate mutase n=1 Tax=Candidatus Magasanikbacteria bacterium RIFOXYD1_FULL_40_23 TaxID=1798705 RepID=A0A1F6P833_9BACT|nr:MAG: phosphoglycerate mutase (2,3-diphosphoglycerate-independent) [Candidatus Magasanikbacteria bacterium RIFOXYD1_FULL_40_23]OGH92998.1 MAG: phosphoglycerate mutase (2,3-diphosphoglycerate-independent) [Candidatus Magasanikbacteria bacterium RIFOXYD2_FULL_39_9]
MSKITTTLLVIVDGWGVGDPKDPNNPVTPETAPNYFSFLKKYPNSKLEASGESVGLFKGQEGNSEAGHLNLGAGRVVKQDALFISDSIKDGTFYKNPAFHEAFQHVRKNKSAVHLMGLLSNHSSAHSYPEHLYALLNLLNTENIKKVYLHLFTDGRDSGRYEAHRHFNILEKFFHGNEKVATIMGRYYAMDRNKNWERTKLAYEAMVLGKGEKFTSTAEVLRDSYNKGESDEFLLPCVITEKGKPVGTIKNNDAIIFFNLRSDRARQLTKAFVQPDFAKVNPGSFRRSKYLKNISFVGLTDFGPDLPNVVSAFPSRDVKNSLVQVLCPRKQMYIAESEKFAHITYFLNGGYAQHFCDENWIKIDSTNVKNYADNPEMSAEKLADYVIGAVESGQHEFIAVNFANMDMVGHTGNLHAAQKAVRVVDSAIARIMKVLIKNNGQGIITADHGNIEEIVKPISGEPDTEHSTNPVPFILINCPIKTPKKLPDGKLANVAPTILKMMGINKPVEMTAKSLI